MCLKKTHILSTKTVETSLNSTLWNAPRFAWPGTSPVNYRSCSTGWPLDKHHANTNSNTQLPGLQHFAACTVRHLRTLLGNPMPLANPFPTRILIHAFLMAEPHSVKASPHRLCAFNNEVWAGTISPLCHTRTDPWGDFLVVMVLIQQSLPQRPGSLELRYTHTQTHTQYDSMRQRVELLSNVSPTSNSTELILLKNVFNNMVGFTPTSQLGTNNSLGFDLTDRVCGWQVFSATTAAQPTVKL